MKRFDPSKRLLFIHIFCMSLHALCYCRLCAVGHTAKVGCVKSNANDMIKWWAFRFNAWRRTVHTREIFNPLCDEIVLRVPKHEFSHWPLYCVLKSISSSARMWCVASSSSAVIHAVDDETFPSINAVRVVHTSHRHHPISESSNRKCREHSMRYGHMVGMDVSCESWPYASWVLWCVCAMP